MGRLKWDGMGWSLLTSPGFSSSEDEGASEDEEEKPVLACLAFFFLDFFFLLMGRRSGLPLGEGGPDLAELVEVA